MNLGTGAVTLNTSRQVTVSGGTLTVGGAISGTGSLTKAGAGTMTLAGANTYVGTTTISAGTLQVGNNGASGSLGSGAVVDNSTLVFNRSDNFSVANAISGIGTLTKTGAGKLTLSGVNTYSGTTTISAGTLELLGGAAISNSGAVSLANTAGVALALLDNETIGSISGGGAAGGNIQLNGYTLTAGGNDASTTYAGVITGTDTSTLTKIGAGTLTLTGTSTFTGHVIINVGTVSIGSAANLGAESTFEVNDGATLQTTGTMTFNSSLFDLHGAGGRFDVASGTTLTTGGTSGYIRGSGGLTKVGGGTLTLNGLNTYTGDTTISEGTLSITGAAHMGGGSYAGAIINNGALLWGSSDAQRLTGVISGSGGLTKTSTGELVLSATNSYTGATVVSGGTLHVDGSLAAASAVSVASGATLMGAGTINGAVTVASGGIVTGGHAGMETLTLSSLTFSGAGTINIGDLLNYTSNASVAVTGALALNGGAGAITLNMPTAGVDAGTYRLISFGSGISDVTGFTIGNTPVVAGGRQTGTLTLGSGYVNYVITDVTPHWTGAGDGAWNTTSTNNWVANGATTYIDTSDAVSFDDTASGTTVNIASTVTPQSVLFENSSKNFTLQGTAGIAGATSLVKKGSGTLTITNSNTYTGGTFLWGGTLVGNSEASLGNVSGALVFAGDSTLHVQSDFTCSRSYDIHVGVNGTIQTDGTLTHNGFITGYGRLIKQGSGTLILSGTNNYVGGTTVDAGTLRANNNEAFGAGEVQLNGGHLDVDGHTISNSIVLNGGEIGGDGGTFSGTISGSSDLVMNAASPAGATTLGGDNTYTGATRINAGTLKVINGTAIPDASSVVLANTLGAALELLDHETVASISGGGTTGGNIQLNGYTLTVGGNNANTTYAGVIHGEASGDLVKTGSGTLTLTGISDYAGRTVIEGGTVSIADRRSLGVLLTGKGLDIKNAATLQVTENMTFRTRVFNLGTGGGSLEVVSGKTLTIGNDDGNIPEGMPIGYLKGSGGLFKTGAGTLVLNGANSYSGDTTISGGTLEIGYCGYGATAGQLGNGVYAGNIINAGALVWNSTADQVLSGQISGAGTLAKSNSSKLTLSGSNTYSGGTTITAGTLSFASGSLGSSGAITMNGGTLQWDSGNTQDISSRLAMVNGQTATLDTNGNDVTLATGIGGSSSGGLTKEGAGKLTLSGTNTYTGKTSLVAGIIELTGSLASELTAHEGTVVKGKGGTFGGGLILASGSTHAPGASPGKQFVAGTLEYNNATLEIDIWTELNGLLATAGTDFDQITAVKDDSFVLTLTSAPKIVVDLNNLYSPIIGNSYVIIQGFTNTVTDGFNPIVTVQHASTDWATSGKSFRIDYSTSTIALTVIPEPGTAGLVTAFLAAALLRRRRFG